VPPGKSIGSGDSPFASPLILDEHVCNRIGTKLGKARNRREWTLADVANRLLLSTAQVSGLERADANAFHNPAFFASALRKYAVLMAVPCPDAILTPKSPPIVPEPSGVESTAAPESGAHGSRFPFPIMRLAGATVILVAAASALTVYLRSRTAPPAQSSPAASVLSPPAPAAPPAPPAPVASPSSPAAVAPLSPPAPTDRAEPPLQEPVPTTAAANPSVRSPVSPGGKEPAGAVTLSRPAWVFVRYGNNSVTERVLQAGQSLTLTSPPIYLAIGAGEGVTLTLRGRPIDVSPFRNGDQIRIGARDLAALAR